MSLRDKPSEGTGSPGAPFNPLDLPDEPTEGDAAPSERRPRSIPIGRPISQEAFERLKGEPGAPESQADCGQEDTAPAEENA